MNIFSLFVFIHVLSATVLFSSGIITAIVMVEAFIRKHPKDMALASQRVVKADWFMTLPSAITQAVTGIILVHIMHIAFSTLWVVWSIILYSLSIILWIIVVQLQIHIAELAQSAYEQRTPFPQKGWGYFKWWVALGWPTFLCFLLIFWLMVTRPI
ncbi:Uncharacterized membrane protein [Commensalibacter communis]|uniref:DUF2269 family protein n=1 Tax=Commensalibacter communis TaxID=2972786 RepID=UPI0022FF7899|nr:DUF2269 domain-containing protein [Commensalibacter communis]CAI3940745.1 Uncharacterized membrane protein [Commensalibacter communis]CAI3942038.1 Uncharacterized membrane protein [Commensalibacter communis]